MGRDEPLHALRMVHFGCGAAPFLPYPHCSVPASADELETGRAPVAAHDRGYVRLVYLGWLVEGADVERV